MASDNTHFNVVNLLVPAFGAVRGYSAIWPRNNDNVLEWDTVTIDDIPFVPQGVYLDATDVSPTDKVRFEVLPIGYVKLVQGGTSEVFNFPAPKTGQQIKITTPGNDTVRCVFTNTPVLPESAESGGVGVADVNVISPNPLPVTFAQVAPSFNQASANVTDTSSEILAANANRKYLLIQNKSESDDVYVNFTGAAATVANGYKISAGGAIEIDNIVTRSSITAIAEAGLMPTVVVIEGV